MVIPALFLYKSEYSKGLAAVYSPQIFVIIGGLVGLVFGLNANVASWLELKQLIAG